MFETQLAPMEEAPLTLTIVTLYKFIYYYYYYYYYCYIYYNFIVPEEMEAYTDLGGVQKFSIGFIHFLISFLLSLVVGFVFGVTLHWSVGLAVGGSLLMLMMIFYGDWIIRCIVVAHFAVVCVYIYIYVLYKYVVIIIIIILIIIMMMMVAIRILMILCIFNGVKFIKLFFLLYFSVSRTFNI